MRTLEPHAAGLLPAGAVSFFPPMPASRSRPAQLTRIVVFTLALFAVFVAANWRLYFATPLHEHGDYAVNALQIDDAKHLREIHGNYSRFLFHHPGPAFFYVYAGAEWLLYDGLHVVPSPGSAHQLAGLFLQVFFFATALTILVRWLQAKWFLPLALLFGWAHFALAQYAFTSIWPPHVLLMPFLCFFVAIVSTAAGRAEDLPWAVLAGGFLVHGHVAQPLFVGLLFPAAWLVLAHKLPVSAGPRWSRPFRVYPRICAVGLGLAGLFLVPLVIDAFAGRSSNLAAIYRQFTAADNPHNSVVQSFLYFLSFFSYLTNQEALFDRLRPASFWYFWHQVWFYVAWAAVVGGGWWLWRRHARQHPADSRLGLLRHAAWFYAATFVLILVWGVWQTGSMYSFNGFFYFSFIYVLGLFLVAGLALTLEAVELRWLRLAGWAVALALPGLVFHQPSIPSEGTGLTLRDSVFKALAADTQRVKPVFLAFEHKNWAEAAGVALALKRQGRDYYVHPFYGFMFGPEHCIDGAAGAFHPSDYSLWQIARFPVAESNYPLSGEASLRLSPEPLSPVDGEIDLRLEGNHDRYVVAGIAPSAEFAWTDLAEVYFVFRPEPGAGDVELTITAFPAVFPGRPAARRGVVYLNGHLLADVVLRQEGSLALIIPRAQWNERRAAFLRLSFPGELTPYDVTGHGDRRLVAWGLKRFTFRPAPPTRN